MLLDEGTFAIEFAGAPVGRERFTLRRSADGGARLELDAVLDFEDQRVAVRGWLDFDDARRPRAGHHDAVFGGRALTLELGRDANGHLVQRTAHGAPPRAGRTLVAPGDVHLLVANGVVSTLAPVCDLPDVATTRTAFPDLTVTIGASEALPLASAPARAVRTRRVVLAGTSHYVVACEGPRLVAVHAPLLELLAVRDGDLALASALAPAAPRKPPLPAGVAALPRQVALPATVGAGDTVLDCTLTVPAAYAAPLRPQVATAALPRLPAVVFITGSGRHDRDGDAVMPGGLRVALFAHLAARLALRGVASLRCDDLGSARSTGDFALGTRQVFTAIAQATLDALAREPMIDPARLGVIGHSEGGYLAPLVALVEPRVRALVLLAAPGRTLEEVAAAQAASAARRRGASPRAIAAAATEARAVFAAWRKGRPLPRSLSPEERAAWQRDATWFKSYLDHDPLAVAARLPHVAVLVLQGDADRQVEPSDADRLVDAFRRGGNQAARAVHYPALGHLFTRVTPSTFADGVEESSQVDPALLDDVGAFLGTALGVR